MPVIRLLQQNQVGLLAHLNGANPVCPPNSRSRVDGGRGNGLRGRQPQVAAAQRNGKLHVFAPGRPGVDVGCQCQQAVGFQNCPGRGVMRVCQAKRRAGQRDRHRIALRQCGDVFWRSLHQMICRSCAQLSRQAGPAQVVKLIGVNFERKAEAFRGL